jgi:Mg2+-importing ATPase
MSQVPLAALLAELGATPDGLSTEEARGRRLRYGPNEPAPGRRGAGLWHLLGLFLNPLAVILLLAAGVSALVGEEVNAGIIVAIVAVSAAVNFAQTYRSQRAVARLRQTVVPTATALRGGAWGEVAARDLVPGDVIRLSAGDLVPADARLLHARDLHVAQAALTGESLPVEKVAGDLGPSAAQAGPTADNVVLLGTSVISGTATAVVYATGPATAFGDVAARLAARPPETEFERGTRRFGQLILRTVVLLVLLVFLAGAARRHDPLESLLFAVALGVGLTPEFLPMIVAVTLARGAVHMAGQKVVVKQLSALQNFGSMDVLCCDKTGTLTEGVMALEQAVDPGGRPGERPLHLAYLNSLHETGVRSPLDAAILRHPAPGAERYHKLDEVPFDFERRRLSVVVEAEEGALLITKGAPEAVLPVCAAFEEGGGQRTLDDEARRRCRAVHEGLSGQGYRVLAVASRAAPRQEVYRAGDERELVLAGFLAFSDPLVPDVGRAVEALRADGVVIKVLTGDGELVARHVCSRVGLDVSEVVLGEHLERMGDSALGAVAERVSVFARLTPAQKNRVLHALKARGHVVGFLGDGVNDAPCLRAADVGISVAGAVDVARDAAEVILLESRLAVLHAGILEGRRAFGNVMKYLLMGTSSNFGNMFSMAAAALFLPFLPMLPTQVLLNNFLYDLAQVTIPTDNVDPSFVRKPRRWDIALVRDFMVLVGPISSLYDFLTFFVLLRLFRASEAEFHTGWFVESLATQTLVLFVIRTAGNPFRSRPSPALTATVLLTVAAALVLPYTPLAGPLGFVPLPAAYYLFLAAATATYLLLVELAKRRLMRRLAD